MTEKKIDTDKEMQEMQDSQASLVNALESIKNLLAQSESKLSLARESLSGKHSRNKLAPSTPVNKNEPVVPVLDDIVFSEEFYIEETIAEAIPEINTPASSNNHTPAPELLALFKNIEFEEPDADDTFSITHNNPVHTTNTDIDDADINLDIASGNIDTLNEQYKEALLQAVDHIQTELETEIEQIITHTVTNLEIQLTHMITEKLQLLRKNIEREDD